MEIREEFNKISQVPPFEETVEDKSLLETADMSVLQINVGRKSVDIRFNTLQRKVLRVE